LDDSLLSAADEALIEERLAAHRADPNSSVPLEKLKVRLRSRIGKGPVMAVEDN
jgi:putative addiction module component (TIGR02574 family)